MEKNPPKRTTVIDAIRGFSLLGILMANILIFQYGVYGKDELHLFNPTSWDLIGHDMLKIFVEGSFMPIFSFLFGFSMIKMKDSLTAKGLKFGRNIVRRSILLIILGFLHSLLWEGDILLFYGTITFFLLMFVNRKPKTLMIWGSVFLLLSIGISYGSYNPTPEDAQRMMSYVKETIDLYGTGTYSEIMYHRINSDPLGLPGWVVPIVLFILVPLILGALFLFGMAAAKRGRFMSPGTEKKLYLRYAVICVPVGIAAKTMSVILGTGHTWSTLMQAAGGQILAIGYIYLFAFLYAHSSEKSVIVRSFEAVGRMSLTNYLMQTFICVLIFYGFGIGLFGKLGVLPGILLALMIYTAQAVFSLLILNRFRIGPVEWLLRIGTYWSWSGRPKLRRQQNAAQVHPKTGAPLHKSPQDEITYTAKV